MSAVAEPASQLARKASHDREAPIRAKWAYPFVSIHSTQVDLALGGGRRSGDVALGLIAARPAPILGVDGDALASSVIGGFLATPCEHLHGDVWKCSLYVGLYAEHPSEIYRVEVDGLGCWSAGSFRGEGGLYPRGRSGCLTIVDYLMA